MKRKKVKPPKKKRLISKRSFTAKELQDISTLSEMLGNIIPATTFGSGFCFQKIATENGLKTFWKKGNKQEQICFFIKNVLKYHPKVFYKILRENLPKGIKRRHKQGSPVLKAEIEGIDTVLKSLSVNFSKEIAELNLPVERPRIVPPPIEYQKILEKASLHPLLIPDCIQLYKDGHINESVRKSLEKLEKYVQDVTGQQDLIGKDLMAKTFNEANQPKIKITPLISKSDIAQQEGFRYLNMGLMMYWRNKFSHGDQEQISYIEACSVILFVSEIIRIIEISK
ncbi:MAG: TIGR02391 family protein [Candidatus Parcubacteria bacterium]|nr:TIGR02391 family protein [Candidatus Parcubacteria bacterium]